MNKSTMPPMPGAAVMTDTLDFVKNLWGSMSVPGMNIPGLAVPTLSVEELDKKINDLKAVEAWLNLNMSMLRGTIQALEVQRGTIATLKTMGDSFAAAVKQPGAIDKSLFDASPYASVFFQHAAPAEKPAPQAAPQAERKPPEPPPAPPADKFAEKATSAAAGKGAESAAPDAAAMGNPAAWWNLLQDQFQQAVATALASDPASVSKTVPAKTAAAASPASPAEPAAKPKAAKASKA